MTIIESILSFDREVTFGYIQEYLAFSPFPQFYISHAMDLPDRRITEKRPSKVRGAQLPQEYELSQFIQHIHKTKTTWNTSNPACEWEGVTCDEELNVMEVNWGFMFLSGSPSWGDLCRTVRNFSVWENGLTGGVSFSELPPGLSYLQLSTNAFSGELDLTHLPARLESLLLKDNKFEGNVDLTHLPSTLRKLCMSENQISGKVNLTGLPRKLSDLSFPDNKLTGPLDLEHLPPSLVHLDCENNNFTGVAKFDRLPRSFEILRVTNNPMLSGYVETSKLPKTLKCIWVGNTRITSNIKRA